MVLIERLNSLSDGDHAVDLLVGEGQEAVEPLRHYLLDGKPSHLFQPRQRAVTALAGLGAKDVLIEYLYAPKEIVDPLVRFGEEAVINTAARLLAVWQTDEVFDALLHVASTQAPAGVIDALASFKRPETIELFIEALKDDFSRNAAENALKQMGEEAKSALFKILLTTQGETDKDHPSLLRQRKSAINILSHGSLTAKDWPAVKILFSDPDPEISTTAVCMAIQIAGQNLKKDLLKRLTEKIPFVSWDIHEDIENCLVENYHLAKNEIGDQMMKLKTQTEKSQARDRILHILSNVQRRVGAL